MIIKDGKKFACFSCIRGHRASSCGHVERELREIRRKGRPVTQCGKCRELRKTRKAHVKCLCNEIKDGTLSTILPPSDLAEDSPASKYRRLDNDDEGATRKVSSIDNLLNPCQCSGLGACKCCQPALTDFLHKSYPHEVVEEAANAVRDQLKQTGIQQARGILPNPSSPVVNGNGAAVKCPSGPTSACCKTEDSKPNAPSSGLPQQKLPILKAAAVAMQQSSRPQPPPQQLHPAAAAAIHNPATANKAVTLPARNIHGLRLTQQTPTSNEYNSLPSIRNYKEPATTIAAIGGNGMPKYGGMSSIVGHHSAGYSGSIMDRPKCNCGCDCDEKVALLVKKIEERLGLPIKNKDLASAHVDGESASEWVERILSPVVSAMHPPSLPSFPSLPPISAAPTGATRPRTTVHPVHGPQPAPLSIAPGNGNRGRVESMVVPPVRKVSGTFSEPQSARNRSFSTGSNGSNGSRMSLEAMSPLMQQQQQQQPLRRSPPGIVRQNARPEFAAGVVPPIVPSRAIGRNGACCFSAADKMPATGPSGNHQQQWQRQGEPSSSCCSTAPILPQQVLPVRSCCDPPAPSKEHRWEQQQQQQQQQQPHQSTLRRVSSGQPVLASATSAHQDTPKPQALELQQPPATAVPAKRTSSMQSLSMVAAASLSTPTTAIADKPGRSSSCGGCGDKCSCCSANRRWQPRSQQDPAVDADGALECGCGCHKPFQECSDCVTDLCEGLLLKEAPL